MLVCSNCGQEIKEDIEFCPACGTPEDFFKTLEYREEAIREPSTSYVILNWSEEEKLYPGLLIDDKLEITYKIGYNLIYPVYRVYDRIQQVDRILILLPPLISENDEAMEYIFREISAQSRLSHPNILAVTNFQTDGPIKYIETEYSSGESLSFVKLNSARKRLSEKGVRKVVPKIITGLAYAYEHGLLHRSLKPQNILITPGGLIKIKEFGLTDTLRNALNMVQEDVFKESLLYMSPEQIRGKELTIRSDIYSLGATMYDLLRGHPPFYKGDIYNQIIHEEPEDIPWVSDQMNRLVKKCLAKEPRDRFADYDQLLKNFKAIRPIEKPPTRFIPGEEYKRRLEVTTQQEKQEMLEDDHEEPKYKSGTRPFAIISSILIFLVLSFLILRGTIKIPWTTKETELNSEEAWQRLSDEDRNKIDRLIEQADARFRARNLIKPPGDNAYELYMQVLNIFPQDDYARNQIELIRKDFLKRARELVRNLDFEDANRLLKISLQYFPADSQLVNLLNESQQLIQQEASLEEPKIRIVNGSGKKGLAKKLSRLLRKEYDYKVVRTDNYRKNGRLIKDEKYTYIKLYGSNNLKVQRLARQLGLKNIIFDTTAHRKKKYTLDIIIGQDFERLPLARQIPQ